MLLRVCLSIVKSMLLSRRLHRSMSLLISGHRARTSPRSASSDVGKPLTAGIIVIGDEILKGQTKDSNSHFLTKELFKLGVRVERISVVPDSVDLIAHEVAEFAPKFNHVFTSGGIGPTHDDMTFEGVAKAFGEQVEINVELRAVVEKFFGVQGDEHAPAMKLAKIPKSAQLLWGNDGARRALYPVVRVRNVVVFPGIPRLLERSFSMLKTQFANSSVRFFARLIFVSVGEFEIANILTEIADKYRGAGVNIGSYPELIPSYYKVKVTVDATDEEACRSAHDDIVARLRPEWIVHFDPNAAIDADVKLSSYVQRLRTREEHDALAGRIGDSLAVIESAFKRYSVGDVCLSFNGGKDCTALLHLVCAFLQREQKPQGGDGGGSDDSAIDRRATKLKVLYISHEHPFAELEAFVEECVERYNLDFLHYKGDVRHALTQLRKEHPEIKAVFMGTRHSDPHCAALEPFARTDEGWPDYVRVSPLLPWQYHEIWSFLRDLWIPYCPLYDRGYTSIGNRVNTHRNKSLEYVDRFGFLQYQPAYKLVDASLERAGRVQSTTPVESAKF